MIKIYIGRNGLGKSEKLKELHDKNEKGYKFWIESNKNLSPETLDKDGVKGFWKTLEEYLNKKLIKSYKIKYNENVKSKIFLDLSLEDQKLIKSGNITSDELENKKILQSSPRTLEAIFKKTTFIQIN